MSALTMMAGPVTPRSEIDWGQVEQVLREFSDPENKQRVLAIRVVEDGCERAASWYAEHVEPHETEPIPASVKLARHMSHLATQDCQSFPQCHSGEADRWECAERAMDELGAGHIGAFGRFAELVTLIDLAWDLYERNRQVFRDAELEMIKKGGRGMLSLDDNLEPSLAPTALARYLDQICYAWRATMISLDRDSLFRLQQNRYAKTLVPLQEQICPRLTEPGVIADYFAWSAMHDCGVRFDSSVGARVRSALDEVEAFSGVIRSRADRVSREHQARVMAYMLRKTASANGGDDEASGDRLGGSELSKILINSLDTFAELCGIDKNDRQSYRNALETPCKQDASKVDGRPGRAGIKAKKTETKTPPIRFTEVRVRAAAAWFELHDKGKGKAAGRVFGELVKMWDA